MKNLTTKKNVGFLGMLEGTLAASLLGNMLAGKAVIWWRSDKSRWKTKSTSQGQVTIRASQDF